MQKTIFTAALVAFCSATEIVYKKGKGYKPKDFRPRKEDWPMSFYWPREEDNWKSFACTATMISDSVAITAAHCIDQWQNGVLEESDQLLAERFTEDGWGKIVEIRASDCWDLRNYTPWNNDLALLYFENPIPNAVEGQHYLKFWDPSEHIDESNGQPFDLEGENFILAGYGMHGKLHKRGRERHLKSTPIFHRGYNTVNKIRQNLVKYSMDKPKRGGLPMESMAHNGDSGSAALYEKDGEKYIIGVKSYGEGARWGSKHAYVWTGGPALDWIQANMNRDITVDPYVSAEQFNCQNWKNMGSARGGVSSSGDFDDEEDGFSCPCDCEREDTECLNECHRCLGRADIL